MPDGGGWDVVAEGVVFHVVDFLTFGCGIEHLEDVDIGWNVELAADGGAGVVDVPLSIGESGEVVWVVAIAGDKGEIGSPDVVSGGFPPFDVGSHCRYHLPFCVCGSAYPH